jgi:outer membrane protein TolC
LQQQKNANALLTLIGRSLDPNFFKQIHHIKNCVLSEPRRPEIDVMANVVLYRPDIQAAIYQLRSAESNQKAAYAAFFPNISISANAGYRARSWSDLINAPNEVWTLGPAVAFAVFDGGARRAAKAQADAQYRVAQGNYRQAVLLAIQELEDSLASIMTIDQQNTQLKERIAIAEENLRLAKVQNDAGFIGYEAVLNGQMALNNLNKELISLQLQKLIAVVLAYRVSGFGLQLTGQ